MLSCLIPAFNEADSIVATIQEIKNVMGATGTVYEIIVIDDGSRDNTAILAQEAGVKVVRHPKNGGYGLALKTGMRHASYDWIAIVDADGSYPIQRLQDLLNHIPHFDMVVGARTGQEYWGSARKRFGRLMLNRLVEFVIGQRIPDINSGFRIFRKEIALAHSRRISSGFSFTTTLTLAMFLESHFVHYVPVDYFKRTGKSKVKMGRDTLRLLQILVQAILYYNPLKLFLPVCIASVGIGVVVALLALLAGSAYGLLVLAFSILVAFVIGALGLVAEEIRLTRTL
jgi:polyisoprenyl-phosphate glycosyltransferase